MGVTYELYVEPAVHQARMARARSCSGSAEPAHPAGSLARPLRDQRRRAMLWVLGIYRRPLYNCEDLADPAARLPGP
jgi:hypothetical protein